MPRVVPDAAAEAAAANDVEVLIAKLDENLGRVIDVFRALDADASGSVSKREFRKEEVVPEEPSDLLLYSDAFIGTYSVVDQFDGLCRFPSN